MSNLVDRVQGLPSGQRERLLREISERLTGAGGPVDRLPARPDGQDTVPLSHLQEQLWFLDRLTPGEATYNVGAAFRLRGPLDVATLCHALDRLVHRHEALRTSIHAGADGPVQVVSARPDRVVTVEDLTGGDPAGREAQAQEEAAATIQRPFRLDRGPLIRARIGLLGPRDYLLAIAMHHICGDGWSAQIIGTELAELYRSALAGTPADLPRLEIHYPDFAVWQRGEPRQEELARQLAYWERHLADLPTLALPADRARPPVPSDHSAAVSATVTGPVVAGLRELAARCGATLFMTLVAAFDAVLSRYGGQDDIVVGTTITGRSRPELTDMVGHFVNMLVLRTDLAGNPPFTQLLERVRQTVLDAWRHQDVPLEKVVERLRPERDPGRNPLFQVGIQLLGGAAVSAPLSLPDLQVELLDVGSDRHPFDLSLTINEQAEALELTADYRTDLFDRSRIARLLDHLRQVLPAVVERPELRLGELPLLSATEAEQILSAWQGPRRPYLREPIHEQIAEQARRAPHAIAVRCGGAELTYAELLDRAGKLARHLQRRGVRQEEIVAVALERGPDAIVAMVGVLIAGGAFVPLDFSHPANRLEYVLADTGARFVLTREPLQARLPEGSSAAAIRLDADWEEIAAGSGPTPPAAPVTESSLAYVIYTSGSTGKPKGVLVEHGGLSNFVAWMTGLFELGTGHRMLQYCAFTFDLAEGEIFAALTSGATLVLVPDERRGSPEALGELLQQEQASYLGIPPAVLSLIPVGEYPELRQILAGGEALPGELVNRWRAPGRRFINGYGPAEATIGCSYYSCEHREWRGQPPIGRAMPNRFVYVLDRFDQPLPVGVPGEITVGGFGLARGYLNQPELTARRFVANPFRPGELMYRTGDLGMWSEQGQLQFLGRIDSQVKLRGMRIELEEIEACLARHPDVAQAAVALREEAPGQPRLVGYVTAGGRQPSAAELRAHLARELPTSMVPASFVTLAELPLTTAGKVDRPALPAPVAPTGRAPRSPQETVLCELFAEVLETGQVGIDDSFFDLGGHSLLVIRLIDRIREELDVEVDVRTLFEAPTVAGIAHHLAGPDAGPVEPAVAVAPAPPVEPAVAVEHVVAVVEPTAPAVPARVPLSYAQQRLWFLAQLEGPTSTYNVPLAVRLQGRVDVAALRTALADVVERHESLRTVFPDLDGQPYQHVLPADQARPELRVSWCTEETLPAVAKAATDCVFDLAVDPPLRAWLLSPAPDRHVLVVVLHHIAADGLSLAPLMRDLDTAYRARLAGGAPQWTPLPMQYADHARRQRERLGDPADPDSRLARQLAFWTDTLAGIPDTLDLPIDRPRPAAASYRGDLVTFPVPADLHGRLVALAREHRVTLFMLLQAAVAALLTRHGAGTDIPIGTPTAGRTQPGLADLVGFFVNTLVLRTDTAGDPSFSELLARVRAVDLAAYSHQDLPFEQLVGAINPPRSTARHPLFQVMLTFDAGAETELRLGDLTGTLELLDLRVAKFDLAVGFEAPPGQGGAAAGMQGSIEYATDLFDRDTVEAIAGRLVRLLAAVADHPDRPIGDVDLISPPERQPTLDQRQRLPNGMAASAASPNGAAGSTAPVTPNRTAGVTPAPVTPDGAAGDAPPTAAAPVIWSEPDLSPASRPPRSPREELLCELFAEVLGVARVGIDDGFFDLGGHSLAAAHLAGRVRTVMGLDISVRSLFDTPTVAGLLDGAGAGERDSFAVLLPLRDRGDQPPLFCVHPFTGLSWCYSGLARHLAPDRPVYGLQSPWLRQPGRGPATVEEIAREQLAAIRRVQPHGPYHLLGWSFGGLVAHAIATQLQAQGEQVGLLAVLDAYPLRPHEAPEPPTTADVLSVLLGGADGYDPATARELAAMPDPDALLQLVRERNPSLAALAPAEVAAMAEAAAAHLDAMRGFTPDRYHGELAFFLATEGRPDDAPAVDRWRDHVTGAIDVREIGCTHWQLTEPAPLAEVGRALAAMLG